MTPTTLRTVAADFVDQIRQITPDFPLFQDQTWQSVEKIDDVPGAKLRLFHCSWENELPQEDGIYGSAIEHTASLYVWTNYRSLDNVRDNLTQDTVAEIISADARQLWLTLEARCDPTLDGLLYVNPAGWTPETDESGHEWGYHEFEVRYLLSHTL